jgi:Rad3-related DNA helicase
LSDAELDFYCGIPSDAIERACIVKPASAVSEKHRVCISVEENLQFEDKMVLVRKLVQESKTRTLVLFNNVVSCQKAQENLKDLRNIFNIPSYAKDRPTILKAFLNADHGVLLTSSTVFWEGITIKNLRLLIIVEPPFPRPRLIELMRRKVTDGRIDMRRRLLQGLGRVGRRKGESGVVITLFDPRIANSEPIRKEFRKMRADECSRAIHELLTIIVH